MGVLFALFAAAFYGGGDFAAGLASRRLAAGPVTVFVEAVGVVAAGIGVVVFPGEGPSASALGWGALSGIGAAVGVLGLFHGLSVARMTVVAPVSAVVAAVLPVIAGIMLLEERLSGPTIVSIVVAVVAIGLVSGGPEAADVEDAIRPGRACAQGTAPDVECGPARETLGVRTPELSAEVIPASINAAEPECTNGGSNRAALAWGTLAGAGFALLFIALDQAGTGSGAWPLLPSQIVSLLLVAPFGWAARHRISHWRTAALPMVFAGIAGGSANLLFLAATSQAQLALIAVITSLYPAATVILARVLLGERWTVRQATGLTISAVAIVMTSLT